eukprot:gene8693-640_t
MLRKFTKRIQFTQRSVLNKNLVSIHSKNYSKENVQENKIKNDTLKQNEQDVKENLNTENDQTVKETKFQKLKKYGKIGLIYWTLFYIATFFFLYGLIFLNVLNVSSIVDFILEKDLYADKEFLNNLKNNQQELFSAGNFSLVFILNELLELARLPVILATLPYVFKKFKK